MPAADDMHVLAGAYALDAVSSAERLEFERHLDRCRPCRDEIAGFRETAARLAAASAVRPRAVLRDQARSAASRTRQLPPLVPEARPGPRRAIRLPAAAAAAAAVTATVLGVVAHGETAQLATERHSTRMIAEVLSAPDAVILTARLSSGGSATVVVSRSEHACIFTASGLPALPGARTYELWLMGPHGDRPAGLLPVPAGGMAGPSVLSMHKGDRVGLTVEPAGGSARPTSAPLVLLPTRSSQPGRPAGGPG